MKHLIINTFQYQRLYKEFDIFIQTKGYNRGRRAPYADYVKEFLFFMEQRGINTVQEVKANDVISYYEYLQERPNQKREGGLSDSYIKENLFGLRLFFDYLLDTEQITSSPVRLPKFKIGSYKQRNIVSLEEIKQLYSVCENSTDTALLSIAYGCGLRRTEIQNLNTGDVMLYQGLLLVRDGKFGKSRTVPLSDTVIKALKEYVLYGRSQYVEINLCFTASFFVNKAGNRMAGNSMNDRLKELVMKTNNASLIRKEITLHCLRHSIATHLMDKGASIEFVQSVLGHSGIDTTHLYAKRRKQRLKILSQIK